MINEMRYNEKSDIWALGCLLFEMCALVPPFEASNQLALAVKINAGKFNRIPPRYSEDLHRAIRWMLQVDSTKRPNVEELEKLPRVKAILDKAAGGGIGRGVSTGGAGPVGAPSSSTAPPLPTSAAALARREAECAAREAECARREEECGRREAECARREQEWVRKEGGKGGVVVAPGGAAPLLNKVNTNSIPTVAVSLKPRTEIAGFEASGEADPSVSVQAWPVGI